MISKSQKKFLCPLLPQTPFSVSLSLSFSLSISPILSLSLVLSLLPSSLCFVGGPLNTVSFVVWPNTAQGCIAIAPNAFHLLHARHVYRVIWHTSFSANAITQCAFVRWSVIVGVQHGSKLCECEVILSGRCCKSLRSKKIRCGTIVLVLTRVLCVVLVVSQSLVEADCRRKKGYPVCTL